MFLSLRKIRQDNSGVIMVTVLVLVLVMSVVAIGILGVNISQVSTSQSVVDTIKAEQLAMGAFYQYHQRRIEGLVTNSSPIPISLDGKTYTVGVENQGNLGPNNANQIEVTVNFTN